MKCEPVAADSWFGEASRFLDHNYQQSWAWGEVLGRSNSARCEHVRVVDGGETLGMASVRVRTLPGIGVGVAYLRGGPLTRRGDADDGRRLDATLRALAEEYVTRRRLVLRVLAPVGPEDWNASARETFERRGFGPTDRAAGYRSIVVRIDSPLEDVRARLSRNWKNNLSRGLRKGLGFAIGVEDGRFDPLCALHGDLVERKGFGVSLDAGFYRRVQEENLPPEKFHVLDATLDGQVVSSLLVSMLGDSWIGLIGATHATGAKIYAAYFLFWRAIEAAHERGLRWFDLGGIDADTNPGVYNFKRGMGGFEVSAPGPYELVPDGLRGRTAVALEDWYRKLRTSGS